MQDTDSLEFTLGTQFKGIEEAERYAKGVGAAARAEARLAKSLGLSAQAQLEVNKARAAGEQFAAATGSQRQKPSPLPMGPNQRLLKAGDDFDRAKAEGSVAQIADAHYSLRLAQNRQESAARGAMSPMGQALYSTRINLPGGAAPLLGKTLEGMVGKEKAIGMIEGASSKLLPLLGKALPLAGAFAAIVKAGVAVAQEMYAMADASSKATRAFTDAQAQTGGSVAELARLGLMGADTGKARSFNERIATDPLAMAAASSVGVANLKAPYGDLNFAKKYLTTIERVSKIADESLRRRLAITLGIEEEVARYSLLSERTRKSISETAGQTGFVQDPQAQKQAGEFKAQQDRFSQSLGNLQSAFSQLFMKDIADAMDVAADDIGSLSVFVKQAKEATHSLMLANPLYGALNAMLKAEKWNHEFSNRNLPGGYNMTGQASNTSPMDTNNQLLAQNTQALQYLTKNIGESARAREATDRFRTINNVEAHSAGMRDSFAFGAKG